MAGTVIPYIMNMRGGCRKQKLSFTQIFIALWSLVSSLQSFCTFVFKLRNKTGAFKKSLTLWDSCVQKGYIEMFPNVNEFLSSADVNRKWLLTVVSQKLRELNHNFEHYFSQHDDAQKKNSGSMISSRMVLTRSILTPVKKNVWSNCHDTSQLSKHKMQSQC